jgi:hypothetical protein
VGHETAYNPIVLVGLLKPGIMAFLQSQKGERSNYTSKFAVAKGQLEC